MYLFFEQCYNIIIVTKYLKFKYLKKIILIHYTCFNIYKFNIQIKKKHLKFSMILIHQKYKT